jgi:uncharacterized protein YkwD
MVATLTSRGGRPAGSTRLRRRRVCVAAVALASVSLSVSAVAVRSARAASPSCPFATTSIDGARRGQIQDAVVCLINQRRRAYGLPALRASPQLDRSAQGWSDAMVSRREFSHGIFTARISAAGFDWSQAGENIATGYATPAAVVAAWMASTGHCRNILSPVYREVGTGVSDGDIAGVSSVPGTWTQDFGLLMGQSAASADWGPAGGCPYRGPGSLVARAGLPAVGPASATGALGGVVASVTG